MGAGLVQRALLEPVDDDAKVILCAMALLALDVGRQGQDPAIYWGGHEYLMTVAFGTNPEPGTKEYEAAARAIKRRVQKLTRAGIIELTRPANRHRHARYRLVLPASSAVDNPGDNVRELRLGGRAASP